MPKDCKINRDDLIRGINESARKTEIQLRAAAHFHFRNHIDFLHLLPDMGLWKLSVKRAAELLTLDMWHSGRIRTAVKPTDHSLPEQESKILKHLKQHVDNNTKALLRALERKEIISVYMKKDFDSQLIPKMTYIDYNDLANWLKERNYYPGDILNEYSASESHISQYAHTKIAYAREMYARANLNELREPFYLKEISKDITEDASKEEIITAWKVEIRNNLLLKKQLAEVNGAQTPSDDKALGTRARRTMLAVIAAVCGQAKIDIQARGAAARIVEAADRIGLNISEDTIIGILKEIPDAVEARSK